MFGHECACEVWEGLYKLWLHQCVQIHLHWFLYSSPQINTKTGKTQKTFIVAWQRMKLYECMKTHLLIHLGRIRCFFCYLSFTVKNWNYDFVCAFFWISITSLFKDKPFYPHKVLKTDKKKAVAIYTTYK